jgi:protein-S-isoprenylcysteine O-methyltransferase Ste14
MREAYLERVARWRVPLGFLIVPLYLYFARPTPSLFALGAAIAAVGLAVRAAAAGHLRKGEALARSGPYAYVRHPLYLGSALLVAGFALAGGRVWLGLLLGGVFLAVYLPVAWREDEEMRARFPAEYAAYEKAVPRLLPRLRPGRADGERFDWRCYWRNREYNALLGCLALLLILVWRMRQSP